MTGQSTHLDSRNYTRTLSIPTHFANTGEDKRLEAKTLGGSVGGARNPELAAWYEEAYAYYNRVMTGAEPLPPPSEWKQVLDWMSWASQQLGLGGSNWGEPAAAPGTGPTGRSQPEADPFGGLPGASGNLVHTEEKTRVGFTGNAVRDIWSNEIAIEVAPLSASVTAERTTDTRNQPPEEVLKITVKDPATSTEAVYFVHDFADAKIEIRTPATSQLTDRTGGLVTWKKFSEVSNRSPSTTAESSVAPIDENGFLILEGRTGDTIELNPQADGQDQKWEVWGDYNLTVGTRDLVAVSDGIPDKNNPGQTLPGTTIVVTHPDGSTDTYYVQGKEFKGNLRARSSQIEWGGHAAGSVEGVPQEFRGDLTLNSSGTGDPGNGRSGPIHPSHPEDTQPDRVDYHEQWDAEVAVYNTRENVDIHANFDDKVITHDITAPGTVVIHPPTYADELEVHYYPDENLYKVEILNHQDPTQREIFWIYAGPDTKVVLDTIATKIRGDASAFQIGLNGEVPTHLNPAQSAQNNPSDPTADYPQIVYTMTQWLRNNGVPNATEADLMEKAEWPAVLSPEELAYPSLPPQQNFLQWLMEIDPALQSYYSNKETLKNDPLARGFFRARLVALLQQVFPGAQIEVPPIMGEPVIGMYRNSDNIKINGVLYDLIDQERGILRFQEIQYSDEYQTER